MKNFIKLVACVVVVEGAGVVGSIFTTPNISSWYDILIKPKLAPPNWLFAPVWTVLFAFMGIALYLVWQKRKVNFSVGSSKIWAWAVVLFFFQLLLNVLWSIIFFGFQNPAIAFLELLALWLAILATMVLFAKISFPAASLLLPYFLWVSFAGYLNYEIWQLNSPISDSVACSKEAKICPDGSVVWRVAPDCHFNECRKES